MTERGCTKGDSCKFHHAQLDPKSGRCFNCSGVGHSRTDCPVKKGNWNPKNDTQKKVAKTTKSEGKGNPEKQGKGSGVHESPEKTSNAAATADVSLGCETSKRADGSESSGNPENVSGIISDASTLLKTLKPCTKAVKVKRVMPSDGPTTNALRRGTPQELEASETVLVELAHGSVELKQHPLTGTILAENAVEPIVPLRGLIELGLVIKWM